MVEHIRHNHYRESDPLPVIARSVVPKQSPLFWAISTIHKDKIASPSARNDRKGLFE
ncbi:MAG: hypothetical protein NT055_07875 [Nitrospirae bacterium]|nr:hypothetical protein [Nitrospirota bacterium]